MMIQKEKVDGYRVELPTSTVVFSGIRQSRIVGRVSARILIRGKGLPEFTISCSRSGVASTIGNALKNNFKIYPIGERRENV